MKRLAGWIALGLIACSMPAMAADAPAPAPATAAAVPSITPNDNLIVEGIPPIPMSLEAEIGRYSEFRTALLTDWHPTRREMLVRTRFGDTFQIHRVKMPGGDRSQLTFFPDNVGFASYEPTKGESFIFSKDTGGNEQFQFYRFDFATGESTLLTDGKSRNTSPSWSRHGDRIAYGSTQRNNNDVDLWVVEPAKPGSARMLAEWKGGGLAVGEWSPDDSKLLLGEQVSVNESNIYLADAKTGERTLLTPQGDEKVAYGAAKFSHDGKGIYLTTDQGSEFQRLAYMDLATKKIEFLAPGIQHDVDDIALRPDGAMIAFVTNNDGVSTLHLMDLKTRKEVAGPKLPIGIVGGMQWHNNNKDLGFVFTSARVNADAWSYNLATNKVERWTESETGGLDASAFAMPELVKWTSFDGKTISGFLYHPPAKFEGKRPVIINIHGGPESEFTPGFGGRNNYLINELGVAVICPNVRGSTGFGKTFVKLDNGMHRDDSYKDINALLDWIGKQPGLDASRVMVTGGSYGGFMTLAVATNYNDRIACSVDIVGPSNLVTLLEHTSGYRRDLRRVEYGDEREPKMREYLDRIAPINNVTKITKPMFVIQGTNDPRVPRTESAGMVQTMRKNGAPVWYLEAKDEGHGFQKKGNQDFQFYATVAFMKEYLLKEQTAVR
jgi:dipeptidyl aminopeptidase/acylaminoacyl peptidase